MFVRAKRRFKDGKEHRYWSVVENCRNRDGRGFARELSVGHWRRLCRTPEVVMPFATKPEPISSPIFAIRGSKYACRRRSME